MRLNRKTLLILGGGFVGVLALAMVGTFVMSMLTGEDTPEVSLQPNTPLPAATAQPVPTLEPTQVSVESAFEMRGAGGDAPVQGQPGVQPAAQPGAQQPSGTPVGTGQDWTPLFGTPQAGFSGQQAFPGPNLAPTQVPTVGVETLPILSIPFAESVETPVAIVVEPTPVVSSVAPPTPFPADSIEAVVSVGIPLDAPSVHLPHDAGDAIALSHALFGSQERYEARGIIEYVISVSGNEVYIPLHLSVKEIRPDFYEALWVFDPFDESYVGELNFKITSVGERRYIESDADVGGDLVYENIQLELDICETLMCSAGKASFSDARFVESGELDVRIEAKQRLLGEPVGFLNGSDVDVIYTVDARTALLKVVNLSGRVPLETGEGDWMSVRLGFQLLYDGDFEIVDPEPVAVAPAVVVATVIAPVESPVPADSVVVPAPPTPGTDVPTPPQVLIPPVSTAEPAIVETSTPVPLTEIVDDPESDSDTLLVRVLSHGYEARFPTDWFIFDASVFGELLGSRIEDGLRESFGSEPQPHLVGLEGFDAMPYIVLSRHETPPDGVRLDTFSHTEFSRQTEHKLLVNRGWAVSVIENSQGYDGRLYKYQTTRDTFEWLVFFLREHDVIQVLMEADVDDGEGIDYDRLFRQFVGDMRFGSSIGDDGSRLATAASDVDAGRPGESPRVVGVEYSGGSLYVRFSEPVWVSAADGVFLRVLLKGFVGCVQPCDGSDGILEFSMPELALDDVVSGFVFSDDDGSIRDLDGNAVDHDFTPFTRASYPVVIGVSATVADGTAMSPGDLFSVSFSEPVWVSGGGLHLSTSGGLTVECYECPATPNAASRALAFGWVNRAEMPRSTPLVGDVVFRIDGDGIVVSAGNLIASIEFDATEIMGR